MSAPLLEICVDCVESAVAAAAGGAARVELCAGLVDGGVTASRGMLRQVVLRTAASPLQVMVLIRPRGGDFLYTPDEVEVMLDDIRCAKESGAHGVVVGALRPDGAIDEAVTAELIGEARPMAVTFHRAFDMTPDVGAAFQACVRLGVDRILTSGLANTAAEGVAVIRELVRMAELSNAGGIVGDGARPITILAGAGLSEENIAWLVAETGVHEVHGSARVPVESGMVYRWEEGTERSGERTGERTREIDR